MNAVIRLVRPTRGLAILAAIPGLGTTAVRSEDARDLPEPLRREGSRWPGEGGRRIPVSVGVVLVDVARINLREESFGMAGYLDTSWADPGLILRGDVARGMVRRFRPGPIYAQALEFVNAVEQVVAEREGAPYATEDGRVSQRIRFSHWFQSPLKLKRFPFDSQPLTIVVAPFDPFANDLALVVDRRRIGRRPESSVTDWDIDAVDARVESTRAEASSDPRFLIRGEAQSAVHVLLHGCSCRGRS